ncbi:oligosaccharide flippase family protein [bacterium]|nr:oligosaccharide flippase family protein [bacterium]
MSLWRKSAGYAVGRGIASAMVFLLLPLLTRLMNAEEFGIWQALAFWAGAITVIVQFGTDQSLFKFFILDRTQRGKYLFSSLLTIFSLSIVFLVLCWFFRTGLAGIILGDESRGSLIFLTALWGISDALFFILASLFQAQEQVKMFVIADIMRAALGYGIAILLLMKGFGVSGVLIGWTAAGFAAFVLFLPEIVRQCTFSTDGGIFSPMLKYGFPLAVNMLIVKIFSFSDRWLLARLDSFSSAGEYSAAVKIAGIVAMAVVPIRYAWVARMFNMHRENTLKRQLPTIWRQMSGAMAVITIATIILSPEIFKIMIGPGYEAGLVVVPILAAVYFLDALMLIADAGIYVSGKTVFVPIFTAIASAVNIALNIILIPRYGILGAASSALASYTILLFFGWRMGQFLMPVEIPYARVFGTIFGVIAAIVVSVSVESFSARIIVLAVLLIAVIFISGLDGDIRRFLSHRNNFLEN